MMKNPQWSKDTRFFMDTSSLMEDAAAIFAWSYIDPACRRYGVPPFIVAKSVVGEINRLAKSTTEDTLLKAKAACKLVNDLRASGSIQIVGEEDDDSLADNMFLVVFARLRRRYQLVLFTQDRALAKDILSINNSSSVKGAMRIEAFRVGDDGAPMRWTLSERCPGGVKYQRYDPNDGFGPMNSPRDGKPFVRSSVEGSSQAKPESSAPCGTWERGRSPTSGTPEIRPFELRGQARWQDDTIIDTPIPVKGGIVLNSDGSSLRLTKILATGGEGTAYETNNPQFVCKIYRHDRLKRSTIEKLELMTSRKIRHQTICWPVSVARNANGEGVGCIMPKAIGKELKRSIFIKPLFINSFPDWTRLHMVRLISIILDAMAYLHDLNVLLGDINPGNILVKDESSVFFVDCDSYQVEEFPCPVGMPPYLAPELYGRELRSTLRTMEHEYFSVATLVFMLLHTGKPPYSHQGGGDPLENVRKRHFPYPRGSQRSQGVPDGPWRYMFSHLPRYMKDAFHGVFSDGVRQSVAFWQEHMDRYMNDLRKGYVSDELYPKNFKQLTPSHIERHGIRCGKSFIPEEDEYVCPDCFQSTR